MVVCVSNSCGTVEILSSEYDEEHFNEDVRRTIVKEKLRPHFTCSGCPANLSNVPFDVHPALAALWLEAEEWHLLASDHCDVYGFNIWPPAWLEETSDMVFGGAEERQKWLAYYEKKQNNSSVLVAKSWSCASPGWMCCMAFSEFDYLLICSDKKASTFGHVHHISKNSKKEAYCCTMDELLLHLAHFLREGKAARKARQNNSKFRVVSPSSKLTRPLRLLRKAIIDAMMR
jgi:hypothetical protein